MSKSIWKEGYVQLVEYEGYYIDSTNPLKINYLLLQNFYKPMPLEENDEINHCELAIGQGVTLNIHAACFPNIEYYGNDFNHAQIVRAQEDSKASGVDAHIYEASFQQFDEDFKDLPKFDYIYAHGIYTWVSRKNRDHIINFVKDHLKPHGVLLISYNTLAGWAYIQPIKAILMSKFLTTDSKLSPLDRFTESVRFVRELQKGLSYQTNQLVDSILGGFKKHDINYLVAEYMAKEWHLYNFSDLIEDINDKSISFIGDSRLPFALGNLTSEEQDEILANIKDKVLYENTRDFFLNTRFRSDFFQRNPKRISAQERDALLKNQRFVLQNVYELVEGRIKFAIAGVRFQFPPSCELGQIWKLLNEEKKIWTFKEILDRVPCSMKTMNSALNMLLCADLIALAVSEKTLEKSVEHCRGLNIHTLRKRLVINDNKLILADPVTASAIRMAYLNALVTLEHMENKINIFDKKQITGFLFERFKKRITKINLNGRRINTLEQLETELSNWADRFNDYQLPILKLHRII